MGFKRFFTATFLLMLVMVLTACVSNESGDTSSNDTSGTSGGSSSDSEYKFKIAHVVQESHVWHQTALKFGEELEKLSDGRMSIEIFPSSQLGAEADMVQQLETGAIDIGLMTNAYMSTREVSLNSWFMPYVFGNLEQATAMRSSDEAKQMLEALGSQGLVGLDFIFAGNRHILMKDSFVNSPEDLKGKKVRIIGSPSMQAYWEGVGAGPTPMPLNEVYQSLQTGVIDGIDIDLDALVTEKYYEQAEYLTLTNQTTFPSVVVMSKVVYDTLSAEDQQIVKDALATAAEWGVQEAISRENTNLETLKAEGVKVQEEVDAAQFSEVSQTVIDNFSAQSDIIKSFVETAGK